jgi:hypothetical protein
MKKWALFLLSAFLAGPLLGLEPPPVRDVSDVVHAEMLGQAPKDKKAIDRGRGHKTAKNIKELYAASWQAHGKRLKSLPDVTAIAWDCRSLGLVGPVRDQGQCGKCWDDSMCGVLDSAFIMAGWFKADGSLTTSAQYVMDCGNNGGCNGDDASTVSAMALSTGLPTTQDYGADLVPAGAGSCKPTTGFKFWKIDTQGYVGQSDGIAPTQGIKNAIAAYGPISSAVDAGGFGSYSSGIMQGDGNNIDHDVSIIGWKTVNNVTIWLVKNQWSTDFGEQGYCWIPEGKWSIGTSALWVHAAPVPPTPVPPGPVPPGPTPPVPPSPEPPLPPGPVPPPEPTQTFTFTFTPAPFSFSTGGFRSRTVTITPPAQTVTGTITTTK